MRREANTSYAKPTLSSWWGKTAMLTRYGQEKLSVPEQRRSYMTALRFTSVLCCLYLLLSCNDNPHSRGFAPLSGRVAFDSSRSWGVQIFEMDLRTGVARQLTTILHDGRVNRVPEFSRDGTRIAFVSSRDGNDEIYLMHADGTHQSRLTLNPASDLYPRFSPDSSRIVFFSDRGGDPDIYVMNAAGLGAPRRLTYAKGIDGDPDFSPDGSLITFTSRRSGNYEIYLMNADGSNQHDVSTNPAEDIHSSFSPDGKRLVFRSNRDGRFDLYSMKLDGTGLVRLTNTRGSVRHPSYSPDGKYIVFHEVLRPGHASVMVVPAQGGRPIQLTDSKAGNMNPSWTR